MTRLLITTLCLLLSLLAPAAASDTADEFRYMSFVLRDTPPSGQEARDFAAGKGLDAFVSEWLNQNAHKQRVFRYFNDMFGVTSDIFVANEEFMLIKNDEGIYRMDAVGHSDCTVASGSVEVSASNVWWLDNDAPPIRMCADTQNSFISTGTWGQADWRNCLELNATEGLFHPDCGCGPNQILCWPRELRLDLHRSIQQEFPNRAVHVYENDLSWSDLLAGDQFYGSRLLYHVYLYQTRIAPAVAIGQPDPTTADLARLKSLPLIDAAGGPGFIAYPDTPNSSDLGSPPQRAGVVTMPGFLRQHNNFRSRVRALTERLLCEDVGPSQNTDNIATFVNPDLTDFDREHGAKESCASCHYAMDNQGSAILGWGPIGYFSYFWDPGNSVVRSSSQLGHSFGQQGTGPKFLMDSYVERAAGFHPCMAKTAWEDFSGQAWSALSTERQAEFESASRAGPRTLIRTIVSSNEMRCSRSAATKDCQPVSVASPEINFENDIKTILSLSCSGSGCHSSNSVLGPSYRFIDTESDFRSINASRLTDGTMPPPGSGKTLSDENLNLLLNFLGR